MKTSDFFQHFHDVSNKDGYSFFFDEKALEAVQQKSPNKQFLVQCLMSLSRMSVGLPTLFQPSGPYQYEKHNKETLIEDLKRLQNYCDLVAIKDSNGNCHLRTVISADDIADESLVGRLAIIHEQAHNFQKYTAPMNPLRVRKWVLKALGSSKGSVECNVFLAFSAHKRAREFSGNHLAKCKHGSIWKKMLTSPFVVDLEDETIQDSSGKILEKSGAAIFKGQMVSTASDA